VTELALEPRRHVLTGVEFEVLWERLGLGPTPAVLRLPSPGRTAAERREIQRAGWQGLRERGLAGTSGPDPEAARLLRLLARPTRRLELRGAWTHPVRAVAADESGAGVLAVRQDATVTVTACSSLPTALQTVLPPAPPGPGRAAAAPSVVLAAALAEQGTPLRSALLARAVPGEEAGLLHRMLAPGPGHAQVVALIGPGHATVVALADDGAGIARRTGGVLGIVDGPSGRYLLTRRIGEDAVEWTTVAPADARGVRHRMGVMLEVS
jgi:EspG family